MLLQGGYGYGNILRLRTSLPLVRWFRADLQSPGKRPACRSTSDWPPYDIVKSDDNTYRISIAVAGFAQHDLDINFQSNLLTVTGKKQEGLSEGYLHCGIAGRPFELGFELANHVRVTAADLSNGLLSIELVREIPDALKPRKIAINNAGLTTSAPAQIETQKAAQKRVVDYDLIAT